MFIKPNSGLFQSDPMSPGMVKPNSGFVQSDPVGPAQVQTPFGVGAAPAPRRMIGVGPGGVGMGGGGFAAMMGGMNPSAGFARTQQLNSGMGNGPQVPQFNPFTRFR